LESTKKKKSRWAIGLLAGVLLVLLIVGGGACSTYNSLASKREAVKNSLSDVDVQLQRRAELIPNLVATVKGVTKHEETVFTGVANARARLAGAQSLDEKAAVDGQLSSAFGRLLVIQESYPELKSNQQFQGLMTELAGAENRIGVARRDYNKTVLDYNTARVTFPTVVMANLLGFQRAEEYKADPASTQPPGVEFSGSR
jgi:LemA protein